MTDEEKAEEYANNKYCKFCKDLRFCNNNKCSKWDDTYTDYLNGLAEGRKEKWHDLRKNPDDLPKYKNSSIIRICWINAYGNKCYHDAFYDDKGFYWVSDKTCNMMYPARIIAWCELSEFEEK